MSELPIYSYNNYYYIYYNYRLFNALNGLHNYIIIIVYTHFHACILSNVIKFYNSHNNNYNNEIKRRPCMKTHTYVF